MQRSFLLLLLFFSLSAVSATAQPVHEPMTKPEWIAPFPPFRIAGNLYYVGTQDLGCYLITTSSGYILINTGLAASAPQIFNNIRALGFDSSRIKILLTTQAHYDHVGAMAEIKKKTGARLLADAADAPVLKSGGTNDYEMGGKGALFVPVAPDRLLHDKDTIHLGDATLTMLHHPGHTKGSCSYLFTTKDSSRSYRVLIANMPTIIVDRAFKEVKEYPQIAADYAYTLHAMKGLSFDIWVASHASQFQLSDKQKVGDAYHPQAFSDRAEYDQELAELQAEYVEKMTKEKR
ncbi:MAG: subclass B3 metallo-beta-lactamase [Williamsia sp.]|nr:subclass B3 metallo-beta-lactamase [Williamsia sp.]